MRQLLRTLRGAPALARTIAFAPTALRAAASRLWSQPSAFWPPAAPPPALATLPAATDPCGVPPPPAAAGGLFDGLLLMAVPKKRVSYMRKRIRQHGRWLQRGPHLKQNIHMCAVCERMRMPHRVCDREDCKTYFKDRHQ